ncbi:hypothetical protein Psuf_008810 [Phytohabitans suffuscus]|uniref:Uncharacterized protein n=1 Tax=Phytohabitans suffuscus TaxID=624315 RepID=A0A6F8YC67_9ACTN|nr:hypothetical protein Psuf_008810 [Phytohabitans suffuscus]
MRDYYDNRWFREPLGPDAFVDVPTGFAKFDNHLTDEGDMPREWMERLFAIRRWTPMPRGGPAVADRGMKLPPEGPVGTTICFPRPHRPRDTTTAGRAGRGSKIPVFAVSRRVGYSKVRDFAGILASPGGQPAADPRWGSPLRDAPRLGASVRPASEPVAPASAVPAAGRLWPTTGR